MVTCEVVTPFAQGPLFRVHWNTFAPIERPVTPEVGLLGFAKLPEPLTTVHRPVAGANGAFPAKVALTAQTCWLGPAFAFGLFGLKTTMSTSSLVVGGVQGPLLMVQRSRFTPMLKPETVVFLNAALAKVPVPLTTVHCPVAGAIGALPASVVERFGEHNC